MLKGEKKRIAIDLDDTISNTIEVDYAMCWEYNQMINPSDNELYSCNSSNAELIVDLIKTKLSTIGNFNYSLPTIVVLSQVTELGTCYSNNEIKEICDFCHQNGLYVYIDGARLANAMVNENCGFKEMLDETGVDIATFGGNKNGAMFGEMIIVMNEKFFPNFILHQKQSCQLFSKTRFLGSQFLVMLEQNVWQKNAKNANKMAKYLEKELKNIKISIAIPVQSNAVFANFTEKQIEYLQKEYKLGSYDYGQDFIRLMTAWSTKKEEIDKIITYLKSYTE